MFKEMNLKDLRFYYNENVNPDEFPIFFHWILYLRSKGEY